VTEPSVTVIRVTRFDDGDVKLSVDGGGPVEDYVAFALAAFGVNICLQHKPNGPSLEDLVRLLANSDLLNYLTRAPH
jgi:hypothetical protein